MDQRELDRFEQHIVPHLDAAYTYARYLTGDEHDAQDVVQDASLRALRYFGGFAGGDARAWLLSIVRRCALDWHQRHRHARRAAGDDPLLHIADPSAADARAVARSERRRILRALDALSYEFREVIVLREIEELSYKEISGVVGVPIGTVMSRLARARRRLAALLGDAAEAS